MKRYKLLLLALLLIVNKPLITQNSDNISPASIKNIKKPDDENLTEGKSTCLSVASIENIGKLEHKNSVLGYLEGLKPDPKKPLKWLEKLLLSTVMAGACGYLEGEVIQKFTQAGLKYGSCQIVHYTENGWMNSQVSFVSPRKSLFLGIASLYVVRKVLCLKNVLSDIVDQGYVGYKCLAEYSYCVGSLAKAVQIVELIV